MFWGFRLKQSRVALLHHPEQKNVSRVFPGCKKIIKQSILLNVFSRCFFVAKTNHIFIIRSSWWIFPSWWFFTNPFEKYARSSNWIMKPISPQIRDENKKQLKLETTTWFRSFFLSYKAPSPSPRSHDNWQWRNCSLHHQLLLSGLANGSQKGPL